jgi:hypothetical protein
MQHLKRNLASWLTAAVLATSQLALAPAAAASVNENGSSPGGGEIIFDSLVVRPVGLVGTVAGTAVFIVSLPFSALGGNVGAVADQMVVAPARYTFVRPIGEF